MQATRGQRRVAGGTSPARAVASWRASPKVRCVTTRTREAGAVPKGTQSPRIPLPHARLGRTRGPWQAPGSRTTSQRPDNSRRRRISPASAPGQTAKGGYVASSESPKPRGCPLALLAKPPRKTRALLAPAHALFRPRRNGASVQGNARGCLLCQPKTAKSARPFAPHRPRVLSPTPSSPS